jgi:competence protein ComFC
VSLLPESVRVYARSVCAGLASVLIPAPCRICAQMLDTSGRVPLCRACVSLLKQRLPEFRCTRCGRPVASATGASVPPPPLCQLCRRGVYDFDLARSFGAYTPSMARAILLLKYSNVAPLGKFFAERLGSIVRDNPSTFAADILVPVPLHPSRLKERGYNQAEAIARPLARLLGVPYRSYLLVRKRSRPNKLRLTRRERWETVRGAFATQAGAPVDNLRVLLVDDVFTTGATLDACSRALHGAGAARVVGLTVARALVYSGPTDAAVPPLEPDQ